MKLAELLAAVKEKNLSKKQVEEYYDDLTHVYSAVCIELSELKKKEAFFFINNRRSSDVATKRDWRITPEGQRMLELEAYRSVIPKELSSLKNRIYSFL